jgi:class 3 adenylate cyclase
LNFQRRLILGSALVAVFLSFTLPVFVRMEFDSYDRRLVLARHIRGNVAPSQVSSLFALTENTLTRIPQWGVGEQRSIYRLMSDEGAKDIWVDPHLEWTMVPEELRTEQLPLRPDSDGTVRRVELADETRLSPALRLYASHKGVPPEQVKVDDRFVTVGEERFPRLLPVDFPPNSGGQTESTISLRYLEPLSFHLLFNADNLSTRATTLEADSMLVQKRVKDRLVLLADHTQAARTRFDTPVGDLERHQITYAALDTLLFGWKLWEPPPALSVSFAALFCALAAWLAVRSPSFVLTFVGWAAFSYAYWQVALRLFAKGIYLPYIPPVVGILLSILLVAAVLQLRAFRIMKQLVGEDRASDAARGEIDLGGTERTVTILFTNLPKAIQALEEVDPEESIRARNRYCAYLTKGVRENGGRVLDYQGDFQMAGFCVEKIDPDHALHAVQAGLELCALLSEQYPDEKIHCGVSTGPAAVGYVGAPSAKELAAIGDTTNVAARLLGAAMKQGVSLLITEPTFQLCSKELVAEKLPAVSLKGKTSAVEVYSVEAVRE